MPFQEGIPTGWWAMQPTARPYAAEAPLAFEEDPDKEMYEFFDRPAKNVPGAEGLERDLVRAYQKKGGGRGLSYREYVNMLKDLPNADLLPETVRRLGERFMPDRAKKQREEWRKQQSEQQSILQRIRRAEQIEQQTQGQWTLDSLGRPVRTAPQQEDKAKARAAQQKRVVYQEIESALARLLKDPDAKVYTTDPLGRVRTDKESLTLQEYGSKGQEAAQPVTVRQLTEAFNRLGEELGEPVYVPPSEREPAPMPQGGTVAPAADRPQVGSGPGGEWMVGPGGQVVPAQPAQTVMVRYKGQVYQVPAADVEMLRQTGEVEILEQ